MERSEPTLRAVGNRNPELLPGSPNKLAGHLIGLDSEIIGSIGPSKNVLLVGCAGESIAELLDAAECDVVAVALAEAGIAQAKEFCSSIVRSSLDAVSLPDALIDSSFDAVVFDDALEHFTEPWHVLGDARRVLRDGAFAVAVLPNIGYGATRLALLTGSLTHRALGASDRLLGFTIDSANDLFVRAGYRVAQIERLRRPIFDPGAGNAPSLDRSEFSPALVAEIEAAPDADVVQFVIKATPLSEEAKERSIARELQRANGSLTRANATIERQKAEGRALRALVEQSRIRIEELEQAFSDVSDAAVGGFFEKPANILDEGTSAPRESISRDDVATLRAELESRAALISDLESAVATLTGDLKASRENAARIEGGLADSQTELKTMYAEPAAHPHVGGEKAERRITELEDLLSQARAHNVTAAFLMQAELKTAWAQLAQADRKANDADAAAQASIARLEQAARELRTERDAERSATAEREARDNDRVARITELENMLSEFQLTSRSLEDSARENIAHLTDAAAIAQSELDATRAQLAVAEQAVADDRADLLARITELEDMLSELQSTSREFEENSRENIALLTEAAAVAQAEVAATRAQLAIAEQATAQDRTKAREALDQLRRLLTDSNAELNAARSARAESEARRAESAARERDRAARVTELEGMLSELQANSRYFEESARKDIARLTESSALALSELEAARTDLAAAERMAADDRDEARAAMDRLLRLTNESQAELDAAQTGLRENEARDTERLLRISMLEAARADEQAKLELITADLESMRLARSSERLEYERTSAELESANNRASELQSLKLKMAGRIADLEDALFGERALNAELGAAAEEGRRRFLDLETQTVLALEESADNARRLEEAWFIIYAELESVRAETLHLQASALKEAAAAAVAESALATAEAALQTQRNERESARAENSKVREMLVQTHSALRESRERAERLAGEVAVVKVRAVQAELQISEFERKIEEGAQYARHVESEIAATRKAALAERVVMRDYADEIRLHGEEQARIHVQQIERLTERAERGWRELEQLRATSESNIQKLQEQIASVTAYGQEMRELLAAAERRLLDQTEDTIADMQAESAQLVLLIDTVQSSHFWKLKRWLGRLLGRNRR